MPFKTLIACAAAGAAAGSAMTAAAIYSSSGRKERVSSSQATAPTTPTFPSPHTPTSTAPSPAPSIPLSAAIPPVDPNGLFQYGFPGPIADVHPAPSLVSSFDRRTRNPHWVAEHITPASLAASNGNRKNSVFFEDAAIPEKFRAKLHDYARSGYDRGHQVPAADAKWSQPAMDATFALSNMCPQVGEGFNRDYWAHFEDFCRRLTQRYPSVRVVTGPLYLPRRDQDGKYRVHYEVIGSPPNVAVPTHFYKVIFGESTGTGGPVALGAFVLPNAVISNDRPLSEFEVPLEIVERASGLEFANKLPLARRRRLCEEINCSIIVKEYAQRQKTFGQGKTLLGPGS